MSFVGKPEFEAWEQRVLKRFPLRSNKFKKYRYTEYKTVLVAFYADHINSSGRSFSSTKEVRWNLYHFGNKRIESVSYGYNAGNPSKKEFRFAATDTGGLTNIAVPMNQGGIPGLVGVADPSMSSYTAMYNAWLKHSGKKRFVNLSLRTFTEWIKSLPRGVMVAYVKKKPRERLIIPADLVHEVTKVYYVRNYGGDRDTAYAQSIDIFSGVYCCIETDRIIPNFNENNISNENKRRR